MDIRRLPVALLLPVLVPALALLLLAGGAASADPPGASATYERATVAGWAEGPVYLSPDSGALTTDQATALGDRIDGWRDDVHVAVLPAAALPGSDGALASASAAAALLDRLHEAVGEDGIYVVSFSGRGTYGAGYGSAARADDVGGIVSSQVDAHTLGQVDATLNAILDDLGAPGGSGFPWVWVLLGVGVLAAAGAAVALRTRRSRRTVLPSGEVWAGPADYRPSFAIQPDEDDTLAQRAALAREDVIRLGEEIDREDLPTEDPEVAGHVQAALDAYADASRRVGAFAEAGADGAGGAGGADSAGGAGGVGVDEAGLRQLGEITEHARWQLDCARARLAGSPAPPRRVPCFLDPAHGTSVADWSWAPPGGVERPVPVCAACLARLSAS